MAVLDIKWNPSPNDLRWFSAVWFPLACLLLGFMIGSKLGIWSMAFGIWIVGGILSPIAFFVPGVALRLYQCWMVAAFPIGWTISHLILGAIYYLLITPLGLLMRAFGRDSMGKRFDPQASTYWTPHQPTTDPKRYFRQY